MHNNKGNTNYRYKIEIPDLHYFRRLVNCQFACPVNTDARGYVVAIAEGRYLDAYRTSRSPNPFASICGRVCGAPCEIACRRRDIDEPISIRALKRFVTEMHGVEAVKDLARTVAASSARRDPNNPLKGTKIAIIGSGVAGFTAAHDLTLVGYKCTIFEKDTKPGGMLTYGVPLYRLSRELCNIEMQAILDLGVELNCGVEVGKDVTIPQLFQQGFAAVLIVCGFQLGRQLNIPGSNHPDLLSGIEFLHNVNSGVEKAKLKGGRVVVVGGGNVAFDVSRSVIRYLQGAYPHTKPDITLAQPEVYLVCLEPRLEMLADEIEVEDGEHEGIKIYNEWGPKRVVIENEKIVGLEIWKCLTIFDEQKRFNPKFQEGSEQIIPCEAILLAIGQAGDFGFLKDCQGIEISARGTLVYDPETHMTGMKGVFVAGDLALGAKLFIDAIADAQKVALSIDQFLRQAKLGLSYRSFNQVQYSEEIRTRFLMTKGYCEIERENPPLIDPYLRGKTVQLVEVNYNEDQARAQGQRCLKCNINTIFDGEKCIMCNGCVDVCPTNCLKMVPLSQIEIEDKHRHIYEAWFRIPIEDIKENPELKEEYSVMLKDETACIRCASCAWRCPTNAITMESFEYEVEYCLHRNGRDYVYVCRP